MSRESKELDESLEVPSNPSTSSTRVQPGKAAAKTRKKKIKVLFIHGLKQVPKLRLEKMLGQEFEVSLHTNWATNPVLREAMAVIAGYIVVISTVLGLMHYEGWWYELEPAIGGSLVLILMTIIFIRLAKGQYHDIVMQTVESSISHIEDAIEIFFPDVIVAEDYGAAVAVFMLTRRIWQGPTLLVSSTHYLVADHAGEQRGSLFLPEEVPVVIAQGGQDDVTPLAHAKRLAATGSDATVQVVWEPFIADGHKLESLTQKKLCELVRTTVVMGLLQAQYRDEVGGEEIYFTDAPPELRVSPRKAPQLTSPGIVLDPDDSSPRKAPALVSPSRRSGRGRQRHFSAADDDVDSAAAGASGGSGGGRGGGGGRAAGGVRESAELLDSGEESAGGGGGGAGGGGSGTVRRRTANKAEQKSEM